MNCVPLLVPIWVNSNIRCIEIGGSANERKCLRKVNSNIRCIEMLVADGYFGNGREVNSNIRCIEIYTKQ